MDTEKTRQAEQMNVVIVGHVDHGKSTFIGRLLADTDSLPDGKLAQVKAVCAANSKPFEYAFLLDALKDEQAQGITIDTARCFFKTKKRHYIIIDAPGHIEFLKNMITGAARAEAGLLLIDAKEGVQENSRRHGFMLSLLGIKQIVVLINKMDLVDYDQATYDRIVAEYGAFLKEINVEPKAFVPVSAFDGENLIKASDKMPWYKGDNVLDLIDGFEKEKEKADKPFRMPVQDIYKFTASKDDRRIVAGTIITGSIGVGDDVVFYPSGKTSTVKSVEEFNKSQQNRVFAGKATGLTLTTQLYARPGEIMCRADEKPPKVGTEFKTNLFWLGKKPMVPNKKYLIKIGNTRASVYLKEIINVLDASELTTETNKDRIGRHDVSECILQTVKPIAFDLTAEIEGTGRFVIIDNYEIAGGGIIAEHIADGKSRIADEAQNRSFSWIKSEISADARIQRNAQTAKLIVLTGAPDIGKVDVAKALEEHLFGLGKNVYYLGISNILSGVAADLGGGQLDREEHIRRLGELAHVFSDAGLILISTISDLEDAEAEALTLLNAPYKVVVVNVGESFFNKYKVDCQIDDASSKEGTVKEIVSFLYQQNILQEYVI